ncbi:MAG: protoporphyrinogen oxidase HemJ [Roseofilum sp. SBFL]|uniref:protoporphyrinogen oxidase HemJ n=1 Tax=unclassified Roseofilum TaxID=2620099 RepID=UPI001B01EB21|nr:MULTISPECIES: protoporphyrinogen oxidase HemJ [unclassified Roseofilum]MBP0014206.1 protoporphyrinogen oxidase HemJ [Roseofilum sp. SID3]MBP0023558.1 protoporphyrinogen oxidase HemJ [Roseofilum sp. SID2]MBP0038372.1 protoporphyrinogen oxidase HemJ [Roseofilum sp. SID1]MBP0043928.1 protoporphyrinogen oxidase HemJ [Roseofilum sp. SBFL]
MAYFWFKAFHLIGVVVWFAGLFYLVRLFVYHAEASERDEPAQTILKAQYEIMEKRLYHIITMPGMAVTVAMAIGLISTEPEILKSGWLHIKLALVTALLAYHFYCGRIMKRLASGECNWTGQQFRALNEAPTVLLVVIVLLAVFKGSLPLDLTTWLIFGLVVSMVAAIQLYAKKRRQDKEKMLERIEQKTSASSAG